MRRKEDLRQPRHATCVQCGKPRRRPAPKGLLPAMDVWLDDEFCSTECAKEKHGVKIGRSADIVLAERDYDDEFAAVGA